MYLYLKAFHIVFVVTWFAGLFYMPRLLIYNRETLDKPEAERQALQSQFTIMMRRLWYGITWPSAIITLILGIWVLLHGPWMQILFRPEGRWLLLKLILVILLYAYHYSIQLVLKQQLRADFRYSSQQLRYWNEAATVLLITIVLLVTVKTQMSLVFGLLFTAGLVGILIIAIRVYKRWRG